MPKFCANLSMLYNEVDFLDRFEAASKSGFRGVEYLFPYAFDKNLLADTLQDNKLIQVLHNLPAGDWDNGERGIACLPDRINEFQEGVGQAIEYASALNCKKINVLAGISPEGIDEDIILETFINNIRFAADKLQEAGIRLLIEAINTRDIPGFYVTNTQQVLEIITASGSDNISMQYDIYHMQIMEGDLATTMENYLSSISHIQLADNPGRHEPGSGEINYPFLFNFLETLNYSGWIGCEYKPAGNTIDSLQWIEPYL